MESAPFLSIAQGTECKSVTGNAARNIKRYAIRKNKPFRRDSTSTQHIEDEEVEDKNLLPTAASLRTALRSGDVILELLQCRCSALCGLQWETSSSVRDRRLAEDIEASLGRDNSLIAVANLILSGCTFALRDFFESGRDKLDDFLRAVNRGSSSDTSNGYVLDVDGQNKLQLALFEKLCAHPVWANETMGTLATKFTSSITAKSWLFNIPSVRVARSLQSYSDSGRCNMPFIDERATRRGHRRYLRFRVADDYAWSAELQVSPRCVDAQTHDQTADREGTRTVSFSARK